MAVAALLMEVVVLAVMNVLMCVDLTVMIMGMFMLI